MKQNDVAILLISGFIAAVASIGLSSVIFGNPSERRETVEVVSPITSEFSPLDNRFFNDDANNPTQVIRIEQNKNDKQIFEED